MRYRICSICVFILVLSYNDLKAQKVKKKFFNDVEIELDFNLRDNHLYNYDKNEAAQYLNPSNDKAGLLDDTYFTKSPIGIEGNSNDYGKSRGVRSPGAVAISSLACRIYKPLSVPYIHNFIYVGAYFKYQKNTTLLNGNYDGYSYDNYYNQFYTFPFKETDILFYSESSKMDSIQVVGYRDLDTIIVPRTKLVYFQNPRKSLSIGISLKPVVYRTKNDRFRILGLFDIGVGSSSGKVNVYSTYLQYENFENMEFVFGDSVSSSQEHMIFSTHYELLNKEGVQDNNFSFKVPSMYTYSLSAGLKIDFKFKKAPIRIGVNWNIGTQTYKREGITIGNGNYLSGGFNMSYVFLKK